ncbi:MAG: hypothetical protein Q7V88_00815 [Actinomycetota bacterium]|nr:hypothetical protein [Actinomycetota bacterium]
MSPDVTGDVPGDVPGDVTDEHPQRRLRVPHPMHWWSLVRHARRRTFVAAGVAVAVLAAALVFVMRDGAPTNAAINGSTPITAEQLAQDYGIRLGIVGLIAAGGLVELKFQVIDADKASALFGPVESMPKLAVEGSSRVLQSSKGGHKLTLLDGASYFFLYTNVANSVAKGSQVSFVVNGVRVPHLTVQQ